MNRRGFVNGLAAAAALPLAGCFWSGDVVKRIKIIAKAEVDGKPVEGSTVMELRWRPRGDGGVMAYNLGEALVLKLDGRGKVYILNAFVGSDGLVNTSVWVEQFEIAAGLKGGLNHKKVEIIDALEGKFPFRQLASGATHPLMVAFKDESVFRSVYRVMPEDFAKHFGAGVKFVSLEFETTDEPLTKTLAKELPVLTEKEKAVPDSEFRHANGDLISQFDLPFKYQARCAVCVAGIGCVQSACGPVEGKDF
jgi:hypothetical protein